MSGQGPYSPQNLVQKGAELKRQDPSGWRNRVNDDFEKRRQTPADAQKTLVAMNNRLGALRHVRLPKLPSATLEKPEVATSPRVIPLRSGRDFDSPVAKGLDKLISSGRIVEKEQESPAKPERPASGKPMEGGRRPSSGKKSISSPMLGRLREDRMKALMSVPHGIPPNQEYKLVPRDPNELYLTQRSHLDTLPLELFDSEESDRTPQEWVKLGGEDGTPASSRFFTDREWVWRKCKVVGYNDDSKRYVIEFQNPRVRKEIPRLNLRFDAESEVLFHERVERCKALKEECLGLRRYTAFINSQPDGIFSPIQQSALQGIVGKLMTNSEELVMSRQRSVEQLLTEVRDEYNSTMKLVIIEYRRRLKEENQKLELLGLPPLPQKLPVEYLAVFSIPERSSPIAPLISTIKGLHFTKHPEATLVIQTIYKSWSILKSGRFIDSIIDAKFPMSLYEYKDHQEAHFTAMREKVGNDWHSLTVNLIRDNLNNTFKLFVNEPDEYNSSYLKQFLKMVCLMMREQLTVLVRNSIVDFVELIKGYSSRTNNLEEFDTSDWKEPPFTDHSEIDSNVDISRFLQGPRAGLGDLHTNLPLFVFKMSTLKNKVVFLPPLRSIEATLLGLINIPTKLRSICQVNHEVVPLLPNMGEVPLCSKESCAALFGMTEQAKRLIKSVVDENLKEPLSLAKLYQKHAKVLDMDVDTYVDEWFGKESEVKKQAKIAAAKAREEERLAKEEEEAAANPGKKKTKVKVKKPDEVELLPQKTLQETKNEIQKYLDLIDNIRNLGPTEVHFRFISIDCQLVKEQLILRAQELAHKLMEGLATEIHNTNLTLKNEFDVMIARLRLKPTSVADLSELKSLTERIDKTEVPRLKAALTELNQKSAVLDSFRYSISRDDFTLASSTARYPVNILYTMEYTKMSLSVDNEMFMKSLNQERAAFQTDLEEYSKEVDTYITLGVGVSNDMDAYANQVESMNNKIKAKEPVVASFNEREAIFGEAPDDYADLGELKKRVRPYFELWSTYQAWGMNYNPWTQRPLKEQPAEYIATECETWYKSMVRLEREFLSVEAQKPAEVASKMKADIAGFKQYVPIITWLRNPGLKDIHWAQLAKVLNMASINKDEITLAQLMEAKIENYASHVEDISIRATKEHALYQALYKMQQEWKEVEFQLDEFKGTDAYILKKTEDILTMLDDQILKTQSMRGSPYIKVLEAQTEEHEKKLHFLSHIMEQWLQCQKQWMYLVPIFLLSQDIGQKMPDEYRKFKEMNTFWKKTMTACKKAPLVMEFVNDTDNLLTNLQAQNQILAYIGKKLNTYLDTKRMSFPRFFFLSNDELLSILAQAKNPLAVQPHLSKCFDGINALVFNDKLIITGMQSKELETVDFGVEIDPSSGPRQGNVEIWLKECETLMKVSLKQKLRVAMKAHPSVARPKWVLSHAGQVVLTVNQVMWTAQMVEALTTHGYDGLKDVQQLMANDMTDLIELIRGDLTPLERCVLDPLTVIDVHARDVMKTLIKVKCDNIGHFDWLAQMRYTWDPLDSKTRPEEGPNMCPDGVLNVRMINTMQAYGWEYLGNSPRLVITPLTDRCYRTLMGAVHLCLGGAPEGPAGTGKTETVKDLGKALAIQTIVTNCSDAMNYRGMAIFFKGLASAGAWACFDEFNRIKLEVLSVIAAQVSTLQEAIKAKQNTVFFDGAIIPIVQTCSAFITMNPSEGGAYAGRSELPDNLKVLFRTVAMMIPDYCMIAEICLYAFGYSEATALASKIVACLRLSNEQLSSQQHYDFGMRAVKSVLTACGNLKRTFPQSPEGELVLRAIQDVNVPKFVAADLPLFDGICRDLFPGVTLRDSTPEVLKEAVKECIKANNLQYTPILYQKIIELHDTIMVRHGLMVVGDTNSAKSCLITVLQQAMGKLAGFKKFAPVVCKYINPKSLSMKDLYGYNDPVAQEWFVGILPVVMQSCKDICVDEGKWTWLVFDGPVDAVWIENMNTVLDDNKKLCLANGAQIKMEDKMRMMFQAENLKHASPATVSRCGMVYTESGGVAHESLLVSWLNTLPSILKPFSEEIAGLFRWLVPPCFQFIAKNCKTVVKVGTHQQFFAVQKLFLSQLDDILHLNGDLEEIEAQEEERDKVLSVINKGLEKDSEGKDRPLMVDTLTDSRLAVFKNLIKQRKDIEDKVGGFATRIESAFAFAVIWAIGSLADGNGQVSFSKFFKSLLKGEETGLEEVWGEDAKMFSTRKAKAVDIPQDDRNGPHKCVYDYQYSFKKHTWVPWMETIAEFVIPPTARFHEIVVPTIASVRTASMLELLITHQHHVLVTGATGTGKTLTVQHKLLHELSKEEYYTILMGFCAQSTPTQVMNSIESKLDRRRAGVLGPPPGVNCVIFIDDLHMPAKEIYGAQPPIELLRQWMDYGGWYDVKESKSFMQMVDLQFVAAMPPPVSGSEITARLLRHFVNVVINPYDQNQLKSMFGTILKWWAKDFSGKIRSLDMPIVGATVGLYAAITHPTGLRPTPMKSHYTFNLRDVAKVFQGICTVDKKSIEDQQPVYRLWIHECHRVFRDRLVEEKDMKLFDKLLAAQFEEEFKTTVNRAVRDDETLIFADFQNALINPEVRPYKEVSDIESLQKVCTEFLHEYNAVNSTSFMNLVLFRSALEHIARLCRILRQPRGNALLVGVGGSGRQSVGRLAAFISVYDVLTIEITKNYKMVEWRDDLRKIMKRAGLTKAPVIFLFTDSQIKDESFVEDINSILNDGEVPNLFDNPEEKAVVIEGIRDDAAKAGQSGSPTAMFKFFVERCKENLHVVLCFSPIGEAFRTRLRNYPSLVNCTSIDWFHAWTEEALRSVARKFVSEEKLAENVLGGIVDVCVDMQTRVKNVSVRFERSLRRKTYITPTSYLSLIQCFRKLYQFVRDKTYAAEQRYAKGYAKLLETEASVTKMQAELKAKEPQLADALDKTAKLIVVVAEKTTLTSEERAKVEIEEKACNIKKDEAEAIANQCTRELDKAKPALAKAAAALKGLDAKYVIELKGNNNPTPPVMLAMKALCIMLGVKGVLEGKAGEKKMNYVKPCKSELLSLGGKALVEKLGEENYDKNHIDRKIIADVTAIVKSDEWNIEDIWGASKAAGCFANWVQGIQEYDVVYQTILPLEANKDAAERVAAAAAAELAKSQARLKLLQDTLDGLSDELQKATKKKEALELDVKQCSDRLKRAKQLMDGLGGEKIRWAEKAKNLRDDLESVTGNILVCAGIIAYLGPYTGEYRQECTSVWIKMLKDAKISCSDNFSLERVLGEAVVIQQWQFQKLPKDSFSTENAIIATKALQIPLMIDPQEQASTWIKLMCENVDRKERSLKIMKPSDDGFVRILSNCVSSGVPLLIENVGQELDPMLEPILLKQYFKQGREVMIKLGADIIGYDMDFKLYLTTKLQNPHYLPDISTKVVLVNFMATPKGLEDQMLGTVVSQEAPEMEKKLDRLVKSAAANQHSLLLIETKILEQLSSVAEGANILDNEELVQDLGKSKEASISIEKKAIQENKTREDINAQREEYKTLAASVANLYFCIASLALIDPMYQFSLQFFVKLFIRSCEYKGNEGDIPLRTKNIDKLFKIQLYSTVQRSLFARDKLLFSFLLYLQIKRGLKELDSDELRFFSNGWRIGFDKPPTKSH